MNEAIVRREIRNMLRYKYGLWPDHWPDIPGVKEQPGRPDLVVMNPKGPGFYIEVKVLDYKREKSFPFSKIVDRQRRWLSTWEMVRPHGSYIAIGVINVPHRSTYLVPWQEWLQLEERVSEYAAYLPFCAEKGTLIAFQENKLDFGLLKKYKLLFGKVLYGKGGWYLPELLEDIMELRRE